MKLSFSSKEKVTLAVIIFILLLYVLAAQLYFLSPLKSALAQQQQSLQSEQNLLAELKQKAGSSQQNGIKDTTELQREIPVAPLEDQFILNLQQAESVSNSQIKSMSFSQGGTSGSQNSTAGSTTNSTANSNTSSQQSSNSTASNTNQSSSSNTGSQQQTAQSSTSGAAQLGNPALSKLTVQLSVESPTYEDFEKFISTIESLKRIAVVENINYTGPAEVTSLDQGTQPFTYTLTVSAYYLPGLTDLKQQLPKVDYPAPADKANPLAAFPNLATP